MNQITESHIIQLSSLSADVKNNGTMFSDVEFTFSGLLKNEPDIVQRNISVLHCQIPNSLYATNANCNVLKLDYGGSIVTLTIPVGNYNANSLITAIETALTGVAITTLNITFNSITGKITITNNVATVFSVLPVANSIAGQLGFVLGNTYTSVAQSLTAPYPLNTLGALNLQICSRVLQTKNYNSIAAGTTTLLASVPLNAYTWGVIDYTNTSNIRNTLLTHVINSIDIQIYDNLGYLVDFNNVDWEITLVLDIVRRVPDVSTQLFSNFLQRQAAADTSKKNDEAPAIADVQQTPIEDMEMFLLEANPQNILSNKDI